MLKSVLATFVPKFGTPCKKQNADSIQVPGYRFEAGRPLQNGMLIAMDNKVVHSDPEIMHGEPVFVGTRVPVQNLWDYLEGGESLGEFLMDFPSVAREQAEWVIQEARKHSGSLGVTAEPLPETLEAGL